MIAPALFSSRSEEWETPQALFDRLDAVFGFRLDAAATPQNAKCAHYFTREDDALAQEWSPYRRVWLNPPYGRAIGRWMAKACDEARQGCVVACLVPARTDTSWWHEHVKGQAQVTFLRGRVRFVHPDRTRNTQGGAAFPSALVVYGLDLDRMLNVDQISLTSRSSSGADAPR